MSTYVVGKIPRRSSTTFIGPQHPFGKTLNPRQDIVPISNSFGEHIPVNKTLGDDPLLVGEILACRPDFPLGSLTLGDEPLSFGRGDIVLSPRHIGETVSLASCLLLLARLFYH